MLFRVFIAAFCWFSATSFCFDTAPVAGGWKCFQRSAEPDPDFRYVLNCSGTIFFHTDGHLESTCTDAFLPNGSQWRVAGNQIFLSDSEGTTFAQYQWAVQNDQLSLEKEGLRFVFSRLPN